MKGLDVLIICTALTKNGAAYRRLSYFIKYSRSRGLQTSCVGFLQLSSFGIVKPSRECYGLPIIVSTRPIFELILNSILSLFVTIIILILRPKIVIVSIPAACPVIATYLGCILTRSKLVIDVRDPHEEIIAYRYRQGFSGLIAKTFKKINYSVYRRADAVVVVTKTLATMLANAIRRSIHLVPNGADLEVFVPIDKKEARKTLRLSQDSFLIAYIGPLTTLAYYNILPFLTVVRRIREKTGIDIELVAAGTLYEDKMLIEGFRDVLHYIGVLNVKGIVTLLSACDTGIVPRVGDPIYDYAVPAKFYEYIATGLPVIVTANRGSELAKIVEENNLGFVCEPGSQACLENTILKLATNRSLLYELKRNVFAFRRHIDRKIGAKKLYKLITELLQG